MTTKLEELQRDIERLDQISDDQVAAEQDAVRRLTEVRTSGRCSCPRHCLVWAASAPLHSSHCSRRAGTAGQQA